MASSSTVPVVKSALTSRLDARSGLDGVSVTYAQPGEIPHEAIYLDRVRGVHAVVVTTGGRVPRQEQYTIDLIIHVFLASGGPQVVEDRAFDLLAEVENELADTPRLGLVTVIDWAEARGYELDTTQYADGVLARIKLGVEVFAQLT
jgi:hypothetical protein